MRDRRPQFQKSELMGGWGHKDLPLRVELVSGKRAKYFQQKIIRSLNKDKGEVKFLILFE